MDQAQPAPPTTTDPGDDIVFRLLGWLHANRKPVIAGVAIVAVIGIAIGLYSWKQGQNDIDANAQLLSMAVGSDLRVHATPEKLTQLASDYPSTPAGEFAALLAAENLFIAGNYAEAQRAFSKFVADHPASSVAAQAALGVAASLEAQNKPTEAMQAYQKIIEQHPTELAVIQPAKLTLGRLYEEQNHLDLAFNQYRDLAQSPVPNDLYANEAKERLQLMIANHPELLKQVMGASAPETPSSPAAPPAGGTLSSSPAGTLSTSPAGSNAPHLLQVSPAAAPTAH